MGSHGRTLEGRSLMRSRAHFRSHPLHPMLVHFPIAFLVGGFVADLAATLFDLPDLQIAAWYLVAAGVVAGLIAAVPGLVDYFAVVPPHSSGKKRATRHLITVVSALTLFAIAWALRGGPGVPLDGVVLVLEAGAVVLLGMGGWMGATLVVRNQIGIDHRYARAGKWKESHFDDPGAVPIVVARRDELEVDQMKLLHVGDRRVVLARSNDGYVAFADRCSHRGGSLAGGVMACGLVVCPWHGSQFDVHSGRVCAGPAEETIEVYPLEVVGDEVRLTLR
ncbi:MAG: Rieske 2Fe-2S domain-containing protein [Gemmatimonas sp.]|nr:Rieske 2Fe-2S domain-containing protein [Gemmatimonas sp.]